MKKLLASILLLCGLAAAHAQTASQQPQNVTGSVVNDLGNGPFKLRVVQGSAHVFTSQGSGTGSTSGSSTSLTLTATPAAGTTPCVGCKINGSGITDGTTVTAYNGVTSITLSAPMNVPTGTSLTWGAACPAAIGSNPYVQANASTEFWPMYTNARVCALTQGSPYNWLMTMPFTVSLNLNGNLNSGDLLYGIGGGSLPTLPDVATGSVLASGGVGAPPAWSSAPTLSTLTLSSTGPNALTVGGGANVASSLTINGASFSFGAGGTTTPSVMYFNGASGIAAGLYQQWAKNGVQKWQTGFVNGTTDNFAFYRIGSPVFSLLLSATDDSVTVGSTTASSGVGTGALLVAGGASVAGSINAGNTIFSRGANAGMWVDDRALGASRGWTMYASGGSFKLYSQNGTVDRLTIDDSTGVTNIVSTTASTSPTTGALTVGGGLGVSGAIFGSTVFGTNGVYVYGSGGALGYTGGSGAGGTVTQITSRTTGVTLNKATGAITLFNAAGSTSATTFTVTNSTVAATDTVIISQKSGTNLYNVVVTAVAAGSFNVTFYTTGGTAADSPVFQFSVIKGSNT